MSFRYSHMGLCEYLKVSIKFSHYALSFVIAVPWYCLICNDACVEVVLNVLLILILVYFDLSLLYLVLLCHLGAYSIHGL